MLKRRSTFIFIICFLVSAILWIFNALSKQTSEKFYKKIHVTNIPQNLSLDSLSSFKIEVNLKGSGFELMQLLFNDEVINIDYNKIKNEIISLDNKYVNTFFPKNLAVIEIVPNEIFCFFSNQTIKKVPISTENIEISCKSPYKHGKIIIKPDSIVLSGSEKELNKINEWHVKKITYKNIDKEIDELISLEKTNLNTSLKKINLKIEVEKYTQAETKVPISLINYPKELDIELYPNKLNIKYLIASKNYKKISDSDFKIICDWDELNENKRELKIFKITFPDYLEITNMKELEQKNISIWSNL